VLPTHSLEVLVLFLVAPENEMDNIVSVLLRAFDGVEFKNTYIPLTLYPRRGSKGISDILRRLRLTKII
jgi:hypothetical protein